MGCACSSSTSYSSAQPISCASHDAESITAESNDSRAGHGRAVVYRGGAATAHESGCATSEDAACSSFPRRGTRPFDLDSGCGTPTHLATFSRATSDGNVDVTVSLPHTVYDASDDTNSNGARPGANTANGSVMDLFESVARSGYFASSETHDEDDEDDECAFKLPPPRAAAKDGHGYALRVQAPSGAARPALALW